MSSAFDSFAKGVKLGQEYFHDAPLRRDIAREGLAQSQTKFDHYQQDRAAAKQSWDTLAGTDLEPGAPRDPGRKEVVRRAHAMMNEENPETMRTQAMELLNSRYFDSWRESHGIHGKLIGGGVGKTDGMVGLVWQGDGEGDLPKGLTVDPETFEADLMREVARVGDPDEFDAIAQGSGLEQKPEDTGLAAGAPQAQAPQGGGYNQRVARLESSGGTNRRNPNSRARGIYQWMPKTAAEFGLDWDALDRGENLDAEEEAAFEKFTERNRNQLRTSLGREPEEWELYLAHQQGGGGAARLLRNPEASVVDVLTEAHNGDRELAVMAVEENGGHVEMTSGEFAQQWQAKYEATAEQEAQEPTAREQLKEQDQQARTAALQARATEREGLRAALQEAEGVTEAEGAKVDGLRNALAAQFDDPTAGPRTPDQVRQYSAARQELVKAELGLKAATEQWENTQLRLEELDEEEAAEEAAKAEGLRAGLEEEVAQEDAAAAEAEAEASGSGVTGLFSGTRTALRESSADRRDAAGRGQYAEAAGHAVRGGLAAGVGLIDDVTRFVRTPPDLLRQGVELGSSAVHTAATGNAMPTAAAEPEAPAAAPPAAAPPAEADPEREARIQEHRADLERQLFGAQKAPDGGGLAGQGSGPSGNRSNAVLARERRALSELAFQGAITPQQFQNYLSYGSFNGMPEQNGKLQVLNATTAYDPSTGEFINTANMFGDQAGRSTKDLSDRLNLENKAWESVWTVVDGRRDKNGKPMADPRFRHDFNVMAESFGFDPLEFLIGKLDTGDGKQGGQALLNSLHRNHRWIQDNKSGGLDWDPRNWFDGISVNSTTVAYQMSMSGYTNNPREGFKRIRQDYYDPIQQAHKLWAAKDERNQQMNEAQSSAYSNGISELVLNGSMGLEEAQRAIIDIGNASGWNPDAVNSYLGRGR